VGNISFAGNDENTVANLYDAQFREYGIQGRWPSPDPAGIAAANPANPQSWNRYAYVLNNPVLFFDPLGLDPDGTPCSVSDKGHADPGNSTSCVCDISGSGCIWQTTTVVVSGNPPPPIPTISGPPAGPPAESVDNNPQAFGSGPGNPPPQTKQQCVNDALQSKFGSFVANKVIPEFSLYSLAGGAASIWNFVKGSGIALGAKAAAGGPWAYGKILSVTGKNLAQYPGLSVAAADATEAGAFWTSIGAATLETAGTAALALTAFATGAEAWARGQCKNVP